jgi:hypothetical protein
VKPDSLRFSQDWSASAGAALFGSKNFKIGPSDQLVTVYADNGGYCP